MIINFISFNKNYNFTNEVFSNKPSVLLHFYINKKISIYLIFYSRSVNSNFNWDFIFMKRYAKHFRQVVTTSKPLLSIELYFWPRLQKLSTWSIKVYWHLDRNRERNYLHYYRIEKRKEVGEVSVMIVKDEGEYACILCSLGLSLAKDVWKQKELSTQNATLGF